MDVSNKVVVVTGGSRGIGAGIAQSFLERGMKVAVCARSQSVPEDLPEAKGSCLYWTVDVTDLKSVESFADVVEDELGPIDLWINNAGLLAPIGMARNCDADRWRYLMDVNVTGAYFGARTHLRRLHAQNRKGALINIGSGAANTPYAGWSAYCASKAALHQLTRVLAVEEAEFGNRVFCLSPGVIATGMQELIRAQPAADFPMVAQFRDMHTSGSLLDPGSPAEHILNLAFGEERSGEVCLDVRDL